MHEIVPPSRRRLGNDEGGRSPVGPAVGRADGSGDQRGLARYRALAWGLAVVLALGGVVAFDAKAQGDAPGWWGINTTENEAIVGDPRFPECVVIGNSAVDEDALRPQLNIDLFALRQDVAVQQRLRGDAARRDVGLGCAGHIRGHREDWLGGVGNCYRRPMDNILGGRLPHVANEHDGRRPINVSGDGRVRGGSVVKVAGFDSHVGAEFRLAVGGSLIGGAGALNCSPNAERQADNQQAGLYRDDNCVRVDVVQLFVCRVRHTELLTKIISAFGIGTLAGASIFGGIGFLLGALRWNGRVRRGAGATLLLAGLLSYAGSVWGALHLSDGLNGRPAKCEQPY